VRASFFCPTWAAILDRSPSVRRDGQHATTKGGLIKSTGELFIRKP
jgi:hypothetical protein